MFSNLAVQWQQHRPGEVVGVEVQQPFLPLTFASPDAFLVNRRMPSNDAIRGSPMLLWHAYVEDETANGSGV